ncbi:MAG TPA: ADP-ribosylglycohydrolase family protein [Kiritimatiellia bacterium]|nr:ADP-ribosylglycohydrolase family protein [Kiritimatiellia bacterium]
MNQNLTSRQQWINKQWWLSGIDLDVERQQARDEGRIMTRIEPALKKLMAVPLPPGVDGHVGGARDERWMQRAWAALDAVQATPLRAGYPHHEPDDMPGIRDARPAAVPLPRWSGSRQTHFERVHGALLGRLAGCMLGKPVEFWTRNQIRIQGEITGNWPLGDYFRWPSAAETVRIRRRDKGALFSPNLPHQVNSTRPALKGACVDDDINYTVTGYAMMKRYGRDFTPSDVAAFWISRIPLAFACTAERAAYRNFAACIVPPESARHRNPYREWIGAQIRADYFGYANPGQPERAAEWAWRDACISHVRNGIYGEMWVAAMLAAAAVADSWPAVIHAGLAQIPARCRLREAVENMLRRHADGWDYEQVVDELHQRWQERNFHHWCHVIPNAEVVTLALLWGEDNFTRTIGGAVMAGFDTDCNGATAGSLWGMRFGARAIPALWTKPLRDQLQTTVEGYHRYSISKLAGEMVDLAREHAR